LNQEIVQVLGYVGRGLLGDIGRVVRVVQVIGRGLLGDVERDVLVTRVSGQPSYVCTKFGPFSESIAEIVQ